MARTIVGIFDDVNGAQTTIAELEGKGFEREAISIVARSIPAPAPDVTENGEEPAGGVDPATSGAETGAILGGTLGVFAGIAALALPGLGAILAAGPLLAALTGAGIGAAAGGLLGALTNAGIPEERAVHYAEAVHRGSTLVAVTVDDDIAAEVAELMRRHGGGDIEERLAQWRAEGWTEEQSRLRT